MPMKLECPAVRVVFYGRSFSGAKPDVFAKDAQITVIHLVLARLDAPRQRQVRSALTGLVTGRWI